MTFKQKIKSPRKFKPMTTCKRSGRGHGRPPPLVHAFVLSSHGRCELYGKCHGKCNDTWAYERDAVKVVPPNINLVMMCPVGYTIDDNSLVHTVLTTTLKHISTGQLHPNKNPGDGRDARRFLSPGDIYTDVTLSPSAESNDLVESGIFHRHLMKNNRGDPLRHIPIPHTMRLSDILEHEIRPRVGASRALVVVDACRELCVRPNLHRFLSEHSGRADHKYDGQSVITKNPTHPNFTDAGVAAEQLYNEAMTNNRERLANLRYRNNMNAAALRRAASSILYHSVK